jgi:hypothetical protein
LLAYNSWWQEGETIFCVQNDTTTHEQLGSWQVTSPMHCFPDVDVTPSKYGRIYNILSYDNQYDVTIGNFLDVHLSTLLKCWQVLWVVMGHMCNVNM